MCLTRAAVCVFVLQIWAEARRRKLLAFWGELEEDVRVEAAQNDAIRGVFSDLEMPVPGSDDDCGGAGRKYAAQAAQLRGMGFDNRAGILQRALEATVGNVVGAVEWLLSRAG